MNWPVLDRVKRLVVGAAYLGITVWAVWRTTTFEPSETNSLLPALMCCMFALTTAGAAVGLLFPEQELEGQVEPVTVDREPVYEPEEAYSTYSGQRPRRAAADWRAENYASRL